MNNNVLFCSDPYAQSAEDYYGIDFKNKIIAIDNLNNLIDEAAKEFVTQCLHNVLSQG
jgi:hypothetical protein